MDPSSDGTARERRNRCTDHDGIVVTIASSDVAYDRLTVEEEQESGINPVAEFLESVVLLRVLIGDEDLEWTRCG